MTGEGRRRRQRSRRVRFDPGHGAPAGGAALDAAEPRAVRDHVVPRSRVTGRATRGRCAQHPEAQQSLLSAPADGASTREPAARWRAGRHCRDRVADGVQRPIDRRTRAPASACTPIPRAWLEPSEGRRACVRATWAVGQRRLNPNPPRPKGRGLASPAHGGRVVMADGRSRRWASRPDRGRRWLGAADDETLGAATAAITLNAERAAEWRAVQHGGRTRGWPAMPSPGLLRDWDDG